MKKNILSIAISFITLIILVLSIRGLSGNPTTVDLLTPRWRDNGPFELSPERGRFGLTYSLLENKSYFFSVDIARFIVPDLGYKNGNYVSLFAPTVSYLIMPGYYLGKLLGISQVGSYFNIALFGLINAFLIMLIVNEFTKSKFAGWAGGLIFLFGTPAFAYAVDLYQHHISTFCILLSIYVLSKYKGFWSFFITFFLCALSISVDNPNLFFMLPIGIYAFFRLFKFESFQNKFHINFNNWKILSIIGIILPILFFGWFNFKSYGSPFQLAGTVGGVHEISTDGKPVPRKNIDFQNVEAYVNPDKQQKSSIGFFESRNLLNGLYIILISPDRGALVFTPILLLGFLGLPYLLKKNSNQAVLLSSIAISVILLYGMWGDPWGGWAFGARYLIPAYAIFSIFLGIAISQFTKKWLFFCLLNILLIYSISVNTLGALTTSANPPQVEALALESVTGKQERYSFDRNWEFLISGKSKSFIYQEVGHKYLSSVQYYWGLTSIIVGLILILETCLIQDQSHVKSNHHKRHYKSLKK